ncbi:MAG: PTS sugar transporter subunit IIC [Candidatus Krumholzibacteriia bacterium]
MTPLVATLAAGDPAWTGFAAAVLLGALLALDDTAYAQTWLSQPLPAALLTGAALGDPAAGLALGLPLQLVLVGNLPVGQGFTGDPTTATVAVTAAAVLGGVEFAPDRAAATAVGWLLPAVALLSAAGQHAVKLERRGNTAWMLLGHRTLRDGDLGRIGRLHLRCLAVTAARGAAVTAAALLLVLELWLPLLPRLTDRAAAACALLPLLVPALALGALVEQYGVRRAAPWVAAGLTTAAVWAVLA